MPPRMFQDLVVSSATRAPRGRARVLPVSIAVHGAAFAAIAALPLLREPALVEAAVPSPYTTLVAPPVIATVAPPAPTPPAVRPPAARATGPSRPPDAVPAVAPGVAPALPTDLSLLGTGDPTVDTTPACLHDCASSADAPIGAVIGGVPGGTATDTEPGPPRRAGIDVTPPQRTGGAAPVYPDIARASRIQARVVVECTIDPRGRVVNAVVTRGHPLFDAAALDAVRTWTYRPTLINGVPVAVLMTVTVNFTLR